LVSFRFYTILTRKDEIQIIEDEERGWAWTRALLGVCADEVHICGEERALSIIQKMCEDTGEDVEVKTYKRLTKLSVSNNSVESFNQLRKGDCIVTFSRFEFFVTAYRILVELKFLS
jgi:ATP-dependent RNA helicase SUPV3L1/SUV3